MSSTTTNYLITGANRGIGRGLLESLLTRSDTTVIAGVRDIESASSKSISSLPTGQNSKAIVVHIDNLSEASVKDSAKVLESKYGITKLDVVVANAGIAKYYGLAIDTPLSEVREHFEVNTIGVLALFQATWPLLRAAPKPKFVVVTTGLASIGDMGGMPMPVTAYGTSKAAVNFITRKIHFENPDLIAFPINPGWVKTDMGNAGAVAAGMAEAPVTLKQSVDGILVKIDTATREHTSGTFESFDDTRYSW